ncbi:MAG: hypothetical protein J3R72DRAFT_249349 [Linnemannia gamsii]|nr:MAG: hypothetical protein J3R72DRAFT_249349 [Linnemannia gamsii]
MDQKKHTQALYFLSLSPLFLFVAHLSLLLLFFLLHHPFTRPSLFFFFFFFFFSLSHSLFFFSSTPSLVLPYPHPIYYLFSTLLKGLFSFNSLFVSIFACLFTHTCLILFVPPPPTTTTPPSLFFLYVYFPFVLPLVRYLLASSSLPPPSALQKRHIYSEGFVLL